MIDNGYLFAKDEKRLFINTNLGCSSRCRFCYLPKLGMTGIRRKSWEEVLDLLKTSNYKYDKDTLITIGCFSECFDDLNKEETIKIIKFFLNNGNQVQMSTKRYVSYEDIKDILPLIKYYGQFVIFVSSSTISRYNEYELGTDELEKRFKTFDLIKYNIPVVLYMKPVLQDITIKDVNLYKKLIIGKKVKHIVVGSLFTEDVSDETIHFSNDNKLYYNECDDEEKIVESLETCTRVWRRSTEVVKYLKENFYDRTDKK